MIDGLFKHHIDSWWEEAAKPLARLGMTANQVTLMGLVLVVGNSAAYLWHGSTLVFGLGLAVSFAADSLDGALNYLLRFLIVGNCRLVSLGERNGDPARGRNALECPIAGRIHDECLPVR